MAVTRVLFSLLMAAQLAVAGLIIGLTAARMSNFKFSAADGSGKLTDNCLLGSTPNGVNLCYVAYGWSGVSILATLALSLLECCTCNLCGLGFLVDTIFALAGTAWWAIAGVMFRFYSQQPNVAALPQAQTRGWIIILAWIGCGLFAVAFLVNLYRMISRCCGCCGHSKGSGRRDVVRRRDVESGGGRQYGHSGPQAQPVATVYSPAMGPPPGYPTPGKVGGRQGQFIAQDMGRGNGPY